MPASFSWSAFAKHVFSWRLLVFFAALKGLMYWVEQNPLVERATLPGVDIAMMATGDDTARRTVVVGITAEDIDSLFANTRPIPPDALLRAVADLTKLKPAALVVDVFTEDSAYANTKSDSVAATVTQDSAVAKAIKDSEAVARARDSVWNSSTPIVWAQSADTSTGALLPVLGGDTARHFKGIAAMLAEEDGLVRRIRVQFQSDSAGATAPMLAAAAVAECRGRPGSQGKHDRVCPTEPTLPSDTNSVALRSYIREPLFYTLGDALMVARAGDTTTFAGQIIVLGFVDGSDQVATPFGISAGPRVVADAIETLMDPRGLIRRPHVLLGFGLDLIGMLLVAGLSFTLRDKPNVAALATLALTVGAYFGARFLMIQFGYWTSFLPVMVGVWAEQLVEQIRKGTKRWRESTALGAAQPPPPAPPAPTPGPSAAAVLPDVASQRPDSTSASG